MPIIKDSTEKVFDPEQVQKGNLINAKRAGWTEPKNGIITAITDDQLTVLMLPGIGNVTNYFIIPASEVVGGETWEIKWTNDMITIKTDGEIPDGDDA
ncbi:MAG: DUF5026 domain-containing protein [Clostridiaceae bacterium]|nr:DUF5026 domain-containing protein [Clostridiaceae bacterium]